MELEINATLVLCAVSALVVPLVKRWFAGRFGPPAKEATALLSIGVLLPFFVLGRYLDGALLWPIAQSFWVELFAAWGGQQTTYRFLIPNSTLDALEGKESEDANPRL